MKAVKEGKKGIFLVPLRALAWEKVNELKDICRNILNGHFRESFVFDIVM